MHGKFIFLNKASSLPPLKSKMSRCCVCSETAMDIRKRCDYPHLGLSAEIFYKCDCQMDV